MIPLGGFAYSPASSTNSDLKDKRHLTHRFAQSPGPSTPRSASSKLRSFYYNRKRLIRNGSVAGSEILDDSPALTLSSTRSSRASLICDPFSIRPSTGLGILATEPAARSVGDSPFQRCFASFSQPRLVLDCVPSSSHTLIKSRWWPTRGIFAKLNDHSAHFSPDSPVSSLHVTSDASVSSRNRLESPLDGALLNHSISSDSAHSVSMDSSTAGRSPAQPRVNGSTAGDAADDEVITPQGDTPSQIHTRVASPTNTRPTTSSSTSGSSHLSGLVCNVHRTTGREPQPLVGATTTILGDMLYVFGGRRLSRAKSAPTSNLYQLDLLRRHWTKIEAKGHVPPARYFHSMCALGSTKMVCYGGMSPDAPPQATVTSATTETSEAQVSVLSDIHIYDVASKTWTRIDTQETPQGRYAHCAAILPSAAIIASELRNNEQTPTSQMTPRNGKGGAEMLIVGGQDSANRYIEQISVFNLRSLTWTSTQPVPGRSCGAYRSVVIPLTTMSAPEVGHGADQATEQQLPGLAENESTGSGSPMLMYTNYNFLDVKLELQIRDTDGTLIDKTMQGSVSPPGLRFPSGGIIDNHFVVSGTFLTSSKQEFALWALDLRSLTWAKIDTASSVFSQGSWNRGVLWPRRNAFVILGNRKRNLVEDYNNRRLNFTNMCLVQLEAFGLYDNPRKVFPDSDYTSASSYLAPNIATSDKFAGGRWLGSVAVALGQQCQSLRELSDMDFVSIDGTRLPVNSRMIGLRWGPQFAILLQEAISSAADADAATLRGAPSAFGDMSRNSSLTITPSVNAGYSVSSAHGDGHDDRLALPSNRPRALYLPHTALTLKTLIYYLYTSSLPPTGSPMTTPQILCSLLQLARPYKIDGLLEAVIERLHESLDGRNAAAIFNAAAMGAGGGESVHAGATHAVTSRHPPRTASLAGINVEGLNLSGSGGGGGDGGADVNGISSPAGGAAVLGHELRINSDLSNGVGNEDDIPPNSASTTASMRSQASALSRGESLPSEPEIWDGGWSSVIGLQKRGLRGLMEGRRMRERGKGLEQTTSHEASSNHVGSGGANISVAPGSAGDSIMQSTESGRVGLGIA